MLRRPPKSTLFPYTTLFRSEELIAKRPKMNVSIAANDCVDFAIKALLKAHGISQQDLDRKSTRLNSSHQIISYAVFCLKKKRPWIRPWNWPYLNNLLPAVRT